MPELGVGRGTGSHEEVEGTLGHSYSAGSPIDSEPLRAKALKALTRSSLILQGALRTNPHFTKVRPPIQTRGFVKVVKSTSGQTQIFNAKSLHWRRDDSRAPACFLSHRTRPNLPGSVFVTVPLIPLDRRCLSDPDTELSSQANPPCVYLLESQGERAEEGTF